MLERPRDESAATGGSLTVSSEMEPKAEHHPVAMSAKRQNLILVLITLTQLVQMIPLGLGINSGLALGEALGASKSTDSHSHTASGGRLGSIYGHKNVLTAGSLWWTVWALCGGYSNNLIAMCIMRGLGGIGGGPMVPNIVALIGITFTPGKKRNLGIALFRAMAPVGVDADEPVDPNGSINFVGAYLGVAGLILFNFVWNQAPAVGWQTPYEIALLIVSILQLIGFAYWETKAAKNPILLFTIWRSPSFGPLMLAVFLAFMSLGIFFWYMNIFMQTIRGDTLMQVVLGHVSLGFYN
ncbi:hypothetical protein PG996_000454 [Apiospora saccharicola]|uniref:Major facilitator superfamily (MFS) profile domain-containing protein n=1 Tax=Apiospora saccharicola TaxID=335842 RepID=A0ABR1WDS8_9PEZI